AAGQPEQFRKRRAHGYFKVAGTLDVARHREELGATVIGLADFKIGGAAIADDPGNGRKGLGVVDRRGLAIQAEAGRKRRLETGLPLLAFQRFEQRGFLATNVGTIAVKGMQLEIEARAQNALAQKA